MDLEQRVEALEKQVKRIRAVAGAAFGLAMVAFVFGVLI